MDIATRVFREFPMSRVVTQIPQIKADTGDSREAVSRIIHSPDALSYHLRVDTAPPFKQSGPLEMEHSTGI
jgi:hypothetical protein